VGGKKWIKLSRMFNASQLGREKEIHRGVLRRKGRAEGGFLSPGRSWGRKGGRQGSKTLKL